MVILCVERQKLLIGKLRDHLRVSSRLQPIGSIRIKGIHDLTLHHVIRRGKSALHLIVNHAVDGEPVILQLVVPALLAENFLFLINVGIKNGVHIHVYQILKILVIAARHRVNRLIRIGHCV